MNKKKKQSCLYKQKAINEHIKQYINRSIMDSFGFIYADNQDYEICKALNNIHYKYKVVKFAYKIDVVDKHLSDDGLKVNGVIKPIYNYSKAIKI